MSFVGQTPWSARVPLDPLFVNEINFNQTKKADEGVGCGLGARVRPTIEQQDRAVSGKVSDIGHSCLPDRDSPRPSGGVFTATRSLLVRAKPLPTTPSPARK